jgi:WD40 repeat protein
MNNPYPVRTFKGNRERVNCVAMHPLLRQVASGSDDSTICVWHTEDNRFSFKLVGHKGPVQELDFNPSGAIIASASKDNTVKLWNNKFDGSFSTLRQHTAGVNSVQFFNDGANLITGSDDRSVLVWNFADQKAIAKMEGHSRAVNSVRASHDNRVCATASDDGFVKIWNIERAVALTNFNEDRCVYGVRFNPESNAMATCGEESVIHLYDIRSRFEIKAFKDHQGASNSVAFHPTQPYLLSGGEDAKVRIFDLRTFACVKTVNANHIGTNSVTWSHHGDYFCCGGDDKMVMVWKAGLVDSGREKLTQENENIGVDAEALPRSQADKDNYLHYIKKTTSIKSSNGKTIYNQKQKESKLPEKAIKQQDTGLNTKYIICEELSSKLEKINANLDMIAKTVNILSQRITNNEKAVDGVIEYMEQKYSDKQVNKMVRLASASDHRSVRGEFDSLEDSRVLRK